MTEQEPQIDLEALEAAMERKGWIAADLVDALGVHKSTVSLILSGGRQKSPAVIVARLALALGVSVDHLLGLTHDPAPKRTDLTRLLAELQGAARQLPEERQHDLLLIARAFGQAQAEADDARMQKHRRFQDAVLNALERHYENKEALNILAVLASEFPDLRDLIDASAVLDGGDDSPSKEEAA